MSPQENAPINSTAGILKFLAPSDANWQELKPAAPETATPEEKKKIESGGDNSRKLLNETLLVSLQMQNLMVIAGSGTSLGPVVQGPSMSDLWNAIEKLVDKDDKEIKRQDISDKISYIADKERPNIEDFLSHCDAFLQIRADEGISIFVSLCKAKILDSFHPETLTH